ncbi:bifunctional serine/threonine-protein kinase/formylglycine-generating enzyme family protein [Azospirillum rugosum]|uniref:Formylglycine-generating enzyme required for sulfatase activity/tRNA A-37 threonylcarbamoyl transferase component Bud32 n=1 Tax=Azospirillum rugosum TaxID=416170 RepID=A0ABS4SSC9_9PROT|nr:bifunctional serine/threonine-protein kinase/formylglycine-generating enzyme family protein [Azospirillum rugosum]MBP2295464.1 formylglycine-generating enzyme required for sulfatase activity/tRNA A-37 threonylcarbamoyl transferase component Bud32 [Azospirillum rugosum]MDQ0528343.1 formylglycine-generating enzyme required for sulfatase activity/tRNA A-37 threonylcarbamoyl transferase component Bud32 [Azospirillum rugosum]
MTHPPFFTSAPADGPVLVSGSARFRDWRWLGEGGTSTVYKAYDDALGYDVAIKVLRADRLSDPEQRRMLLPSLSAEVVISRRLRHPNICSVHDLYEGEKGVGVVMDIVEGSELRDWMKSNANALLDTAPQRLDLLRTLTQTLAVAHREIVHRDLKPENVVLRNDNVREPVIMDFGFALLGKASADSMVWLSFRYAAPEQYLAPQAVDRRADLWALGVMAYELFAGEVPPNSLKDVKQTGRVPRIPIDEIEPPSRRNAAVPPALDRIILRLMEYEPDRRFQTAGEVLAALDTVRLVEKGWVGQGARTDGRRSRAIRVEGGDYNVGSNAGSKARKNEGTGRRVRVTPFLIDPYPVTHADYEAFAKTTGHALPPLPHRNTGNFASHPVVGITHAEATAYARWAGGFLPTEVQWECAARGGVPLVEYPWGSDPPGPAVANIDGAARNTTPVGSFPLGMNPLGIGDLCGNVWEWCRDIYDPDFLRAIPKDVVDPVNDGPVGPRVLRGGSFESLSVQGRCAFRNWAAPDERRWDFGFRVAYAADDDGNPTA